MLEIVMAVTGNILPKTVSGCKDAEDVEHLHCGAATQRNVAEKNERRRKEHQLSPQRDLAK